MAPATSPKPANHGIHTGLGLGCGNARGAMTKKTLILSRFITRRTSVAALVHEQE